MDQPAYVLNVARFNKLMRERGYENPSAFCRASGMPIRTFHNVMRQDRELTGPTIRYFLKAFPGTPFEALFIDPSTIARRAS